MTATDTQRGRFRIAEPGEGIGLDELALATRNHGMPLEALRYDVTPPGLHYVLTHYDIPAVDPGSWRLDDRRRRRASAQPALDDLHAPSRRRPPGCCSSAPATGAPASSRGRSASPGCSRRWAPPSGPAPRSPRCWSEAGLVPRRRRRRVHRRRPRRGARRRAGLRPRPVARRGDAPGVPAGVGHERRPAPPAARRPAAAARARLVRDGAGEVADPHRRPDRAVHRLPERHRLPAEGGRPRGRRAGDPDPPAGPARAARLAGLHDPRAVRARRPGAALRARVVRPGPGHPRRGQHGRRADLGGRRRLAPPDAEHPFAWRAWTYEWTATPGRFELLARATDEAGSQPVEAEWNRQGMANNLVQRVPVNVLD